MPRNHPRVTQSSTYMLQSWRGNCDIQILVYDSDPRYPDISEIARITDYVVSYSTKGNTTWHEELEQGKKIVLSAEDANQDKSDILRVTRQIMNKTSARRIISKQEAMCLLGKMNLTACTENVVTVSINNSMPLRKNASVPVSDFRMITRYSKRPSEMEHMNLYDYFDHIRNFAKRSTNEKTRIPNFSGFSGKPTFPVTEGYARHTLIVYRPWREYPTDIEWIKEFNVFITGPNCPVSCKMQYDRVMLRHYHKTKHCEAKQGRPDPKGEPITENVHELLTLCGLPAQSDYLDGDTRVLSSLHRGFQYAWDKDPLVSKVCEILRRHCFVVFCF